ncbi:MAG: MarR family transcriptional regulator [Acidobacteriaceae bacterium]|nr:MarR family transcriptional regulator [Acidobacteriaceae bacterium]MBV9306969.1 MarR family transcriptional regulator [Acidobacteriaceae bacterium]
MRLQKEIKQTKPFRSIQQEAGLALLKTTDLVRRRLAKAIEPHHLSLEQYNVLRILRGAGNMGMATLEVSSRMIEQTPAITRLLDKLEAKKLVRRERCPEDRRQVLCWITDAGLHLLAEMDDEMESVGQEPFAHLTLTEIKNLIKLLDRIREKRY